MVKLHLKTTCREVPIEEIISTGQIQFFKHLSESTSEFKDQKNVERFRKFISSIIDHIYFFNYRINHFSGLIYNGRALNEESLKKITDADSIRVVLLPPLKTNVSFFPFETQINFKIFRTTSKKSKKIESVLLSRSVPPHIHAQMIVGFMVSTTTLHFQIT